MSNSELTAKWVVELADQWITELNMKRIETGYAEIQPQCPYWVRPHNYSSEDWHKMGQWVVETFGHSDWSEKDAPWVASNYKYWFRDERDRTLFILKWT